MTSTTSQSRPGRAGGRTALAAPRCTRSQIDDRLEVLTPDDLLAEPASGRRAGRALRRRPLLHGRGAGRAARGRRKAGDAGRHPSRWSPPGRTHDGASRIHAQLVSAGVSSSFPTRSGRRVQTASTSHCVYTDEDTTLAADAIVLVTRSAPQRPAGHRPRRGRRRAEPCETIGDALAPSTIAQAVWDGHRYAEDLDDPAARDRDRAPFRREIIALAHD